MGPLQPRGLLFLLFPIFLCHKIFNIHLVVSDSIQIWYNVNSYLRVRSTVGLLLRLNNLPRYWHGRDFLSPFIDLSQLSNDLLDISA